MIMTAISEKILPENNNSMGKNLPILPVAIDYLVSS